MIVESKKEGVLVTPIVGKNGIILGNLTILPGCNEIPKEKWEAARSNLLTHIKKGLIVEIGVSLADKKSGKETITSVTEFSGLPASQAERVVEKTYSPETLDKWKKDEPRDSVRVAIANQQEVIKKEGSKGIKKTRDLNVQTPSETSETSSAE